MSRPRGASPETEIVESLDGVVGMSGWQPEQGNGRPSGPPPSGPPLEQPATVFPSSPPPNSPPPGNYGQPGGYGAAPGGPGGPGGYGGPGAPGGYGGPPFGQPPRKSRWKMFTGIGVALALVLGLGVFGFLYFTGRLGFGPLSGADKDAVTTIAKEVDAPKWFEKDQLECAADELVHETRS